MWNWSYTGSRNITPKKELNRCVTACALFGIRSGIGTNTACLLRSCLSGDSLDAYSDSAQLSFYDEQISSRMKRCLRTLAMKTDFVARNVLFNCRYENEILAWKKGNYVCASRPIMLLNIRQITDLFDLRRRQKDKSIRIFRRIRITTVLCCKNNPFLYPRVLWLRLEIMSVATRFCPTPETVGIRIFRINWSRVIPFCESGLHH